MRKTLYRQEYDSGTFWSDVKVESYFSLDFVFSLKHGPYFIASVPNISSSSRNPFKAIFRVLEHESIGMSKYNRLKETITNNGMRRKL